MLLFLVFERGNPVSVAPFHEQAWWSLWLHREPNWEMSLAFAPSRRARGYPGWGCAGVWGSCHPGPSWTLLFPSFSLPLSVP